MKTTRAHEPQRQRQRPRRPRRPRRQGARPRRAASGTPLRRSLMRDWGPAILATFFGMGCAPSFDPASLVASTRVVGARVEAAGPDDRASVAPGESANVTWLVTAPAQVPPLGWAFALCTPDAGDALGCTSTPLAVFQGTGNPPLAPIVVPAADALAGADHLTLYGRVCDTGAPVFDPTTGNPSCSDGPGTTASVAIHVQAPGDVNHNPSLDGAFTFDGQPWPAAFGDPCVTGPSVVAGSEAHVMELVTSGGDRETYTAIVGDPPVPTPEREALQISFFTTAGKLKSPFAFVEAADGSDETPVTDKWNAPKVADVTAPLPVTFTFVVRDGRGGTTWATRAACVTPN